MRARWIIAGIGALLLGVYLAPLLESHPEQDECAFGPVSNARYRELLAEAKRRQATSWPRLVWNNKRSAILLNERFDDLSRGMTSIYERLAAVHAIVRALGGDYRTTASGVQEPYQGAMRGAGVVVYDYHVDLNRIGLLSPIRRQMRLMGHLAIRNGVTVAQDKERAKSGAIQFTVHFPSILEDYIIIPRTGSPCPLVPDNDLAQQLQYRTRER
jgi:hypothetical protein